MRIERNNTGFPSIFYKSPRDEMDIAIHFYRSGCIDVNMDPTRNRKTINIIRTL